MKKVLSLVLALVLCFSIVAGTLVSAEEAKVITDAKEFHETQQYKYFSDYEKIVLPGDAIVAAFKSNPLSSVNWGNIFQGNFTAFNDAPTFYGAVLVDLFSQVTPIYVPETTEEDFEANFKSTFRNRVTAVLGFCEWDMVLADVDGYNDPTDIGENLTKIFAEYNITSDVYEFIDFDNTTFEELGKQCYYAKVAQDYIKNVFVAEAKYISMTGANTFFKAGCDALVAIFNTMCDNMTNVVIAKDCTDAKTTVENAYSALVDIYAAEKLPEVEIDPTKSLIQNLISKDEITKNFCIADWLTNDVQKLFADNAKAAYSEMNEEEATDPEKSATSFWLRSVLLLNAASTESATAADFINAVIETGSVQFKSLVGNLQFTDDFAKQVEKQTIPEKWAAAADAIDGMMLEGTPKDIVKKIEFGKNTAMSFADISAVAAGATVYITTDNYTTSFTNPIILGEDKKITVTGLLPGKYAWMSKNADGTRSYGSVVISGERNPYTAKLELGQAPTPTPSNGGTTPANNSTTPKTADSSVVFGAIALMLVSLGAFVLVRKIRG